MVTFINGGLRLSGEPVEDLLIKIRNGLASEGWVISNILSNSFSARPSFSLSVNFVFSIQTSGQVNYDYSAGFASTHPIFQQELSRESYFRTTNWLNIRANDGSGNFSRQIYNLLFLPTSKFWLTFDTERFSLAIGEPSIPFLWDCVYGGFLQDRVDVTDQNAWGIGFADFRSRCHEVCRARHDNSIWSVIGSRFYTISSTAATNLTLPNQLDNLNNLPTYNPPIHGLLDYFTTFSASVENTSTTNTSFSGIGNAENLWANTFYGRPNEGFYDCSVLMPAFYLEGRTNAANYGSVSSTSVSPQLYYRGNLPFIYSGGMSLPPGAILIDEKTGFSYLASGNYCKLVMRIS